MTVDHTERPEILVGVDIKRMTDAAIAGLSRDHLTYQRGGMLVSVVTVPTEPASKWKRADGAHTIVALSAGTLRERCSSAVQWMRIDRRSEEKVPTTPPESVVYAVMGRAEWPKIRPLVSVATCPQMRPDGSILQSHGYDEQTGILLRPNDSYPSVSDCPRIEDARGALAALREVVCDFPFARPEHEAAWIAGVLTMVGRAAIEGPVPLFAVDATTAGTGKSRLVDSAARIAYGYDAARTAMPDDDSEMRKRITCVVIDGDPAVCIDNIRRTVNLPSLEALLTSTVWKDRVLGATRQVSAPHRGVWWATGNNMCFSGDIARRTIHIRLESSLENPEERTDFRHPNLLAWVARERRRLVASCLTLLRAYHVAGRPHVGVRPWGSFESWSALVPSAVLWAGGGDVMLARATNNDELDEERMQLRAVHDGLSRLRGDSWSTVRDVLDALYPAGRQRGEPPPTDGYAELRDVLCSITRAAPGRDPEPRRVGKFFEKIRGRVLGGRRLVTGDPRSHAATWRVESVQTKERT